MFVAGTVVTQSHCKSSFFITLETSQPSTKSYFKNHWNINNIVGKKMMVVWGISTCLISQSHEKAIRSFWVLKWEQLIVHFCMKTPQINLTTPTLLLRLTK